MSKVKDIVTDIEKLSEWSSEIDTKKQGKLAQEIVIALKATMREHNLTSLSAPQIGYPYRIFCLRFGKGDYRSFVNPMIENNVNLTMSRETCSSIPGKTFIMPRFAKIKFFYTTPLGKIQAATLAGKAALSFQHCLDHLNGMLVSDYGLEIDELFDNAPIEEQEQVLQAYAESLDLRLKNLHEEIAADEELSEIDRGIRFINSVQSGETVIEKFEQDTGETSNESSDQV